MILLFTIGLVIIFTCLYFISEQIEEAWHTVAYKFKISASLAGATLLAISSSLPEFFTSLNGAIFYNTLEIGFMTIIWSAIFNVLVITGIVGITSDAPLIVSKAVIKRDSLVYLATSILLLLLLLDGDISQLDSYILLFAYFIYVIILYLQRYSTHEGEIVPFANASRNKIIISSILGTTSIGLLSAGAVYLGIELSYALGLSLAVISVLIFSMGTSIPDLLLSYFSAKRGGGSAAISNVFGSNTFDITICLAIPALVLISNGGTVKSDLASLKLSLGLLLLSIFLVIGLLIYNFTVTKVKGWICLIAYGCFLTIFLSAMT